MTQYGGEGLPWIGLAPFTDRPHIVQNVGDGSLFHSSYQNIRFCVAAGANITFKLLYNGVLANTGAQEPVGVKSVPALTRLFADEGVRRIAVVTKEPARYRGETLGAVAAIHPVEDSTRVMRELENEPGVTVLIYDESCANERRRRQKRGRVPTPQRFVVINEEVCENCGALRRPDQLHVAAEGRDRVRSRRRGSTASTCNQDHSCLKGDCPSFVTVDARPGTGYAKPAPPPIDADAVPEPRSGRAATARTTSTSPAVGGTGVLTVNALLC